MAAANKTHIKGSLPCYGLCQLFCLQPPATQHFINLRQLVKDYTGVYFYEQCFLNYYFNTRLLSNTTVIQPFVIEVSLIRLGIQLEGLSQHSALSMLLTSGAQA
jgi:hypothetical protein